jgi:hypothetical protein
LHALEWNPGLLKRARYVVFEGTSAEGALRIATVTVVVLGLWLRSRGFVFSTFSLWLDEAAWAMRLMDDRLLDDLIRPIGFMAVTRALAQVFGPSETVLRLLPWCAGVGATLIAPALSERLFRSRGARLLFVAVVALDPAAIDLSKEFKPYSVGLALHLSLVLLALRYCESGRSRDLAGVLVVACGSVLFAQDVMFAYPGLFLVLAISALRSRRFRHLFAVGFAGAIALVVVVSLYVFVWSRLDGGKEESYWGKKYDVFYVPTRTKEDKTDWTAGHYAQIAAMPGSRRSLWESKRYDASKIAELRSLDVILWVLLHVAGLTVILRTRRLREALLVVLPLFVTMAFNVCGFWPFGEFRTNLFVLGYAAAIAAFSIERKAERGRWEDLIPAGVLVLVPLFVFERSWHRNKEIKASMSLDVPGAMKALVRLQKGSYPGHPEKLIADQYTCPPWQYYMRYHPTFSRTIGSTLEERFQLKCPKGNARTLLSAARKELRKGQDRVWIVAGKGSMMRALEHAWPDDLEQVERRTVGRGGHLLLAASKKAAPEPIAAPEPEPEPDTEALGPVFPGQ